MAKATLLAAAAAILLATTAIAPAFASAPAAPDTPPVLTAEEKARLAARCGDEAGEWNGRNLHFYDGILVCGDGKRIDDPEVRAIMARLSERVRARVQHALRSARAAHVNAGEAQLRADQTMRSLHLQRAMHIRGPRAQLHPGGARGLSRSEAAELRADLDRLRADLQRMRVEIRREVAESLQREGVH